VFRPIVSFCDPAMTVFRTPDDRFAALSDWPYEPLYTTIDTSLGSLRVAAIDEGPGDASPVLLMHGEPTWSYLYRHMIAPLVAAGHRVVAPDLPGFGRSALRAGRPSARTRRRDSIGRGDELTVATTSCSGSTPPAATPRYRVRSFRRTASRLPNPASAPA
jgi:pimeloyl-ACP methyl ester carboxylesterase